MRAQPIEEQPITDPRVLAAVNELEELVRSRYSDAASFSAGREQLLGIRASTSMLSSGVVLRNATRQTLFLAFDPVGEFVRR